MTPELDWLPRTAPRGIYGPVGWVFEGRGSGFARNKSHSRVKEGELLYSTLMQRRRVEQAVIVVPNFVPPISMKRSILVSL
jgi:hypothetical protein